MTTTDQDRAIAALSVRLGGPQLKIETSRSYTGEPDDTSLIVSWSQDPADGCLVLDDGTIDLGGGSHATDDPLEQWAADWNRRP